MNEITRMAFFMLVAIMLVAIVVESLKKLVSKVEDKDGKLRLKTRLTRLSINAVAIAFSVAFALTLYFGGVLLGEVYMVFFYATAIYLLQWLVDMTLVKKIFEKIIEKVLNRTIL